MTRTILAAYLATGLVAVLAGLSTTAPASADVVRLKNGGTLEGKVRDTGNGQIEILLPYGSLALEADLVASVERSATIDEEVAARLRQLDADDAQGLYELAQWCRDRDAYTLAGRLLEEVLVIDPDHTEARHELGYRRIGDEWLTDEEAHERLGDVYFRGTWLTAAQRDRILVLEGAVAADRRRSDLEQARLEVELARLEAVLTRDQAAATGGATGLAAQTLYPGTVATGTYYQGVYYPTGYPGGNTYGPHVSPVVERELESREQRRGGSHRPAPRANTAPAAPAGPRHHHGGFLPP